jgi:hypothetical protein
MHDVEFFAITLAPYEIITGNLRLSEHGNVVYVCDTYTSLQCSQNLATVHSDHVYFPALPHSYVTVNFYTILPSTPRSSQLHFR